MCYKDGGCRIYEATDVMELSNWSEQVYLSLYIHLFKLLRPHAYTTLCFTLSIDDIA